MRVRVASLGTSVQALPATGLRVTWDLTNSSVLPTTRNGATIARWRIVPAAKVAGTKTKFRLQYLPSGSSTWAAYATASVPSTGAFLNPTSGTVTTLRGTTQVVYRGQVRGTLIGSAGAESLVPVVALPLEDYLLSVVPSESPSSWPAAALSAQAVAARSFAEYHRRHLPISSAWYDVYDDTRSQVFPGTSVGGAAKEFASTTAAVRATAGQALFYSGTVVFAQFGSASRRIHGGRGQALPQGGARPVGRRVRQPQQHLAEDRRHLDDRGGLPHASGGSACSASPHVPASATRVAGCSASPSRDRPARCRPPGRPSPRRWGSSTTGSPRRCRGRHRRTRATSPNDGRADLVAVEAVGGALRVYPSTGTGGWKPAIRTGSGWTGYAKVLTAGTWDDDAISDVIVQDKAGGLYLRSGTGKGTFASSVKIGAGWTVVRPRDPRR